jgi:SOS response regulatory protein OraA/RecX
MKAKPKRRLAELCSVDEHGNVSDAAIHDALEALSHPVARERAMADTRERVRRLGVSEEMIEQLYGKPLSEEELERALDEVRERARRYGWPEDEIEEHYGKPRAK